MNHQTGKLILISGPSGTGKSTVISRLMRLRDDVCFSVSATTRAPRPGCFYGGICKRRICKNFSIRSSR